MSSPPPPPPPGYGNQPEGYGQPYGQPGYGPYGQPAYGQPGYGYPPAPRDHPKATTVLVLGILSLAVCSLLGPFAWVMGRRVVKEIDASGGRLGGRGAATAGWICGLIATILILVSLLFFVFVIVVSVSTSTTSS